MSLKVLIVHNAYQFYGGEDVVVDAERNLLIRCGVNVEFFLKDNHSIGARNSLGVALGVTYSSRSRSELCSVIESKRPDIVHVHNFFPLLSPSIYDACYDASVSVVQTLHNYRTICPGAMLMREGSICEICIQGSPYNAVWHRCYRRSTLGSLAVARMVAVHRRKSTWDTKVNRFIALTEFAKGKFIDAGFPEGKIAIKPNFSVNPDKTSRDEDFKPETDTIRRGGLFVGRLSMEKGVETLITAWDGLDMRLSIVGVGPLESKVANAVSQRIRHLGKMDQKGVLAEMGKAAFLVMPSECYETFGMVIVEAFSCSLPVVSSNLGAMTEMVEDGVTGIHFEAGNADDLATKVRWMNDHPNECQQMGRNARKVYEKKYTPERNYEMLMDIYQQAIEDARSSN